MRTTLLFLALAVGTISFQVRSDDALRPAEIRSLVQQGKILSLETILEQYPDETHGRLLDLEVEKEHGRIVYELEFLDSRGRVMELEIDAKSGRLLKQEYD